MNDVTPPPDAVLIAGPVGSGKTEAAIDAIVQAREIGAAFSTIWVLLATGEQIHSFRQRLLARSPDTVQFGIEFFNFYDLYGRLLDLAQNPQRQIENTTRYQILRHVADELKTRGELEFFDGIATLPGFIGLVAGLIHELKQGLVMPEIFESVARRRGPKDRDLARLYSAYQDFLQDRRLVDRHGAGWLAVQYLENNVASDQPLPQRISMLIVDGFDQFNGVQVRLLNALAPLVERTVLTLTTEPGRHFRRFEQARSRLLAQGPGLWREQAIPQGVRPPALDHLVRSLFTLQPARLPADGTVSLIEAPDVDCEVQAVLRRVKRLLLDGVDPESITVLVRRLGPYGGVLRETARAYGLPLVVRARLRLRENPAVAAVLSLIDLHALDFPRRELIDTLHSPYLDPPDLTPGQIAGLERISLARQVVRGRAIWLDALARSDQPYTDEDGDDLPALDTAEAAALYHAAAQHFERLTPPAAGTVYEFTDWIMALLGPDPAADTLDAADDVPPEPAPPREHFNVLARVRASGDAERITRDIAAIAELRRVLAGLRTAHDLVDRDALAWNDFRAELELAVQWAEVTPPGGLSRVGRVLVTDVLEARGLPHDHVFILGLAEGEFPAPEPHDALYQASERVALAALNIDLQTAAERTDDMSLFYQAVGLARQSLTLSRYFIDDSGAPCPPSPYWNAVRAALEITQVERFPVGAAPTLDEAATLSEAAVALAAAFTGEHILPGQIDPAGVYNALLATPAWLNVLCGRAIEAQREDTGIPFDHYSGRLSDPGLIAVAAQFVGPGRTWSATQLNDYGLCPFRYFARRLLKLEALQEPEEGPDVMQRGSLNHAILEETYREIAADKLSITPENTGIALGILHTVAESIFADAPRRWGFRPSPVWEQDCIQMLRRLEWLIRQDFGDKSPFAPGKKNPIAGAVAGETRFSLWHEASFGFDEYPPLVLDGPAGPVRIRGKIDRMDQVGGSVFVMDYKSGSTTYSVEDMIEGRNVQMLVYILAAQQLLNIANRGLRVVGGFFWHIGPRKTSGEVLAVDEAVARAQERLHENILAARDGRFVVRPTKYKDGRCAAPCDYAPLCRVSRGYLRKREESS